MHFVLVVPGCKNQSKINPEAGEARTNTLCEVTGAKLPKIELKMALGIQLEPPPMKSFRCFFLITL